MTDHVDGHEAFRAKEASMSPEEEDDFREGCKDRPSFEMELLATRSRQEQVDLLVLAWALLLHRGTFARNDDSFFWGVYDLESGIRSARPLGAAKLSNIVPRETETVTDVLRTLTALTQGLQSTVDWERQVLYLATADLSSAQAYDVGIDNTMASGVQSDMTRTQASSTFGIDVRLPENRFCLRRSRKGMLLSPEMADFQIHGFVDIIKSVSLNPDKSVAETLRVGDHELARLWEWNKDVPPVISRCMHDIIAEKMAEHPDKQAVLSWDGELTYGQLDRLSGHLAVQLSSLGVGSGTSVPMCFEKSMWTVVGLLAVMRAGGTFVLTDPQQPEGRLSTIAVEVDAQVVLTSQSQAALGARIAPHARTVVVGPELLKLSEEPVPSSLPPVPPSALLYIIFTSGSTGKPKGVMISHENFTTGAIPRAEAVGYKSHSRVLDFPSYAFDVSIDCMLCTLVNGGCICVPSDDQRVNDLSGAIKSMNANMAHMTPSVARLLSPDALESLEVLGLGGESLSAGDAAVWSKTTKLIIAYGPSECTVGCTINNEIDVTKPYTSIGKGVGGVTWITDPDDHNTLTPVGAVGELLIEGSVVGVGYLNDPERTAQVFIEDPTWLLAGSSTVPGRHGRLYKTGDLVKYDPAGSGNLVFVGRKDRQVKLRGQRVELAEIEHHILKKLPEGASVAAEVITPGGKDREPSLVAFIAEAKDMQPSDAAEAGEHMSFSSKLRRSLPAIENYLASNLPIYMVPTAYIPLRKMPLLVSCKVDRKRLQEIGLAMTPQQLAKFRMEMADNHEPQTESEQILQKIWKQLLGSEADIGVKDNFFALGGDSLKAMKLVAAARAEGLSLTVAQIFANPTLSRMASAAERVSDTPETEIAPFSLLPGWKAEDAQAQVASLCKLPPSDIEDVYPCTPLQEGLMALSAKYNDAYIAQRVVDLADAQSAHLLKAAFEVVSATCPILRTRIVQVPGHGLVQVVVKGKLPWYTSNSLEEYLQVDNGKPMGLGDALARFGLVTDKKQGPAHVVLTIHHALYDGWSMPLIIDRVNKAYRGMQTAQPTPFKAFIKYLTDRDRPSSETFWREQLQGATGQQFPVIPFPGYQPRADSLLEHYIQFPSSVNSNTTVATAIRAAWALVPARYTSEEDAVFGETLTGRNAPIPGIAEIEGPLIATVPTRVRVDRNMQILEYLQSVHEHTILRIPHEHIGLQHIRRLSADAREACELRTGIVLHPNTADEQNDAAAAKDCPANGFVPVNDVEAAKEALKFNSYALMLVCSLDSHGFLTMASFDSKTVDRPQMQKVLEDFGRTVQELCRDTSKLICDLEVMKDPSPADLLPLTGLGVRSLSQATERDISAASGNTRRTWIVNPDTPKRLVPAGAVGELLLESVTKLPFELVDRPDWIPETVDTQTALYKTGHRAKFNSDGTIVFLGPKIIEPKEHKAVQAKMKREDNATQPMTAKREQLRRLWSRILGIPEKDIGPESSFFALGGDSIGVMKLVSEARLEGLELSVAQVFSHRVLSTLADVMKASAPQETTSQTAEPFSALEIGDVEKFVSQEVRPKLLRLEWKIKDVLPARPLQEIAVKGTTNLPRYSARYELFYLDTPIDRRRMFKSCQEIVTRNEILRTVFVNIQGRCCGVVLEDLEVPIVEYEVEGDLKEFAKKLCGLDIQTKMAEGTPFVKFFFVQGEGGKSCLILKISHAQYDEICLPRLLHQLAALYEQKPVPETLPFSSFVYYVLRENIPKAIPYWRELLKGSTMTVLRPNIALKSRKPAAISRTFDVSGRDREITIATLPTAAWALCLAHRLSTRDVTFGEVVSGRNIGLPNCDLIMGPTWQYVPVRVRFGDSWTGLDLLNFVQQQHIESSRFESMGLKEIAQFCTDWPETVNWFDSVVHQDVEHVESLSFLSANSRMETVYPHLEPLREWKIQAFLKDNSLTLEIVTFEDWLEFGTTLLEELGACLELLVNKPQSALFQSIADPDALSHELPVFQSNGHSVLDVKTASNIDTSVNGKVPKSMTVQLKSQAV
ncbi:Nonribosomal peptide synthase 1 [Exophiala dermatitidis]